MSMEVHEDIIGQIEIKGEKPLVDDNVQASKEEVSQ